MTVIISLQTAHDELEPDRNRYDAASTGPWLIYNTLWQVTGLTILLFVEQHIQANNNEYIKAPHYWPFVMAFPRHYVIILKL